MDDGQRVEVLVEVPRGGRVKLRPDGRLQYISPWAAPFNYGSVPAAPVAPDGDAQDAFLLGPPRRIGERVPGRLVGIARVLDEGVRDDKWLVAPLGHPDDPEERARVARFFHRYLLGKALLAFVRRTASARVLGLDWLA